MEILIGATYGEGNGPAVEIPGIGILTASESVLFSPYRSVKLTTQQLLKLQYNIAQELLYGKESTME